MKLADLNSTNANTTLKHPENLTDSTDGPISHATKRRCMLPFFTHKSLSYIINNLAILPTKKVKSDGIFKKGVILDIKKLLKTLGEELSLSFSQYGEAAAQMFKFQEQPDGNSPDSLKSWTQFWHSHFTFFENREDAKEYFDEWKHIKLKLRHDCWSYGYKYDTSYYSQRYMTAKNNMIQRIKNREYLDSQIMKALEARSWTRDFLPRTNAPSGSFSRPPQWPFQEAGGRASAAAFCILCADQSNTLFHHPRDQSKFPNGKGIWAKFNNGWLTSPDGQDICIKYNIDGSSYCKDSKQRQSNPPLLLLRQQKPSCPILDLQNKGFVKPS
jgi:hypothetical protein